MVCHGGNTEEQRTFFGALDAGSSNGLDDVLSVAFSVGQYEFIEGVTSGKALGSWLCGVRESGVDFPEAVRPYLDYAGSGAGYYASHGGAYTPSGYARRWEEVQAQKIEDRPPRRDRRRHRGPKPRLRDRDRAVPLLPALQPGARRLPSPFDLLWPSGAEAGIRPDGKGTAGAPGCRQPRQAAHM